MKNHQIRSRFLTVSLLGDNLVSVTCKSGNNLQLCTSLSLRTHKRFLNISLMSVRQRCWDIIILQLKSHLKKKHFNNLSQAARLESFSSRWFGEGNDYLIVFPGHLRAWCLHVCFHEGLFVECRSRQLWFPLQCCPVR